VDCCDRCSSSVVWLKYTGTVNCSTKETELCTKTVVRQGCQIPAGSRQQPLALMRPIITTTLPNNSSLHSPSRSMVHRSVCMSVTCLSPCKKWQIVEIKVLFGVKTAGVPRNIVLHCVPKKLPRVTGYNSANNVNWSSKCFYCWNAYGICYKWHEIFPTTHNVCCCNTLWR